MTKNTHNIQILIEKLDQYKNKYYKNLLIKGVLFSIALLLSAFLFINVLEYIGRFNSIIRGLLFFSFIGLFLYLLIFWIIKPLLFLLNIQPQLSNEHVAKDIGRFFPEIGDRLLNTLQLAMISTQENSLLDAGISQKTHELRFIKFADAININENKKYIKYILPPFLLILILTIFMPRLFKDGSKRIVNFQNDFAEDAPFKFKIENKNLNATKNEDFTLNLTLIGNTIVGDVFIVFNDRQFKMTHNNTRSGYYFTFTKVQSPIAFNFNAAGFKSNTYDLVLINRPSLLSFETELNYPAYLNKASETFDNIGNLVVPEGTNIHWGFKASDTDSLLLTFNNAAHLAKDGFGDNFSFDYKAKYSTPYQINLKNKQSSRKESVDYYINVIPDKYPSIQIEQAKDTVLYTNIALGGNISDDYGLTKLTLFYRPVRSATTNLPTVNFNSVEIPFNKTQTSQSFYYQLSLQPLSLLPSEKIEYYVQVWDNDGVNGIKSTKTSLMTFALPSAKNIEQEVERSNEKTENILEKLTEKTKKLKSELNNLDAKLRSKKDIDFQEKKKLADLSKKREDLIRELNELHQQFEAAQEKQNRFQPQSPEMQKKMDQIKALIKELSNEENQKLYEDLKKMLESGLDERAIDQLEKIKNKERNSDKDIDRTLALFKQIQLQQKVNKVAAELDKLADKQENLAKKAENDKDNKIVKENSQEQKALNKEFQEKKAAINELEKLSKELKKDVEADKQDQNDVDKEQQNAEQQLDQKQSNGASKSQKKASRSMRNLASKLMASQKSGEMKGLEEDIDALRDILENLVSLSFDQERTLNGFKGASINDPRLVKLSQNQNKIVDDAKVIEDSLYALAKRVLQIKSFVTREVTTMKGSMDESIKAIRERKLSLAASKQQFSMTSINNLALMLSDVLKQLQAMAVPGSGAGNKKGMGKGAMPLGQEQKDLNEKINKLGKSGKGGKGLSEELSKLAGEQSAIRRRLQQMQEDLNGTDLGKKLSNTINDLQKKMDATETDLVNKRINPELLNRQKETQTRLLEAEKAIQQQEEDNKRTSQTGRLLEKTPPPAIQQFLQTKQKQVELIRTVPPNYSPFYKNQTNSYFIKIK